MRLEYHRRVNLIDWEDQQDRNRAGNPEMDTQRVSLHWQYLIKGEFGRETPTIAEACVVSTELVSNELSAKGAHRQPLMYNSPK